MVKTKIYVSSGGSPIGCFNRQIYDIKSHVTRAPSFHEWHDGVVLIYGTNRKVIGNSDKSYWMISLPANIIEKLKKDKEIKSC